MPLVKWPASLPQRALRDGYGESGPDNRISTTFENRARRYRRANASAWRPVSASFRMNTEQLGTFERFYRETLSEGVKSFLLPGQGRMDILALNQSGVTMLADDGETPLLIFEWWRVKIGDNGYQIAPYGIHYRVALDLLKFDQ